jgi:hypothetical protein
MRPLHSPASSCFIPMRQNGQVISLCTAHQPNPTSDCATQRSMLCNHRATRPRPTVTSIFILTLLEPATALPLLVVMVPGMTDMTIADDPESLSAVFVGWRLSTSRPRWMRNTVCYRGSMLLQRPPPLSLEQISRMPICGTNNRYGDLVSRSSSRLGVVEFDYRR